MAAPRKQQKKPDDKPQLRGCCEPLGMLWMDTLSSQIFVENSLQKRSRLDVRAAVAQSIPPPPPQGMVQQGASDSELDVSIMKEQGKVYRTDRYTVHWRAQGQCRPLWVRLKVTGEVQYTAECLPEEGQVTLSRSYMLEPPAYAPPGPGSVQATLDVTDCAGQSASCDNEALRP
jgi:hypothetical protein